MRGDFSSRSSRRRARAIRRPREISAPLPSATSIATSLYKHNLILLPRSEATSSRKRSNLIQRSHRNSLSSTSPKSKSSRAHLANGERNGARHEKYERPHFARRQTLFHC